MSKFRRKKIFKDEILGVVDVLSKSKLSELEAQELIWLKQRCKRSKDDLNHVFVILMDYLKKNDSKIRYNTIKVINEIYIRSHVFRLLIHKHLHEVFVYTLETDARHFPLPLPVNIAVKLKQLSIKIYNDWFVKYASYYRKLQLGYEFLVNVHDVNFVEIRRKINEEKARKHYREQMKARERIDEIKNIFAEIDENKLSIKANLTEINSCYELIIPKLSSESLNYQNHSINDVSTQSGIIGSEVGVSGRDFSVEISINRKQTIYECDENRHILVSLTDLYKELSHQLAKVQKWLIVLKKFSCKEREKVIELFELKIQLEDAVRKYEDLDIIEEDNDDFIEVPENTTSCNH